MSQLIRCVVAGLSPQAEDDLFFVKVEVPDDFDVLDADEIRHKRTAAITAEREGWGPIMVFDETSPAWDALEQHGVWETFSTVPLMLDGDYPVLAARLARNAFEAALDDATAMGIEMSTTTDVTATLIATLHSQM